LYKIRAIIKDLKNFLRFNEKEEIQINPAYKTNTGYNKRFKEFFKIKFNVAW
jgi:hypothetical protein